MYHGRQAKYQGKEICFDFSETALGIADVTDKSHPKALSHQGYPNVGYAHQGWLTEDQKYVYADDELDEMEGLVPGTRTLIWDVSDLENRYWPANTFRRTTPSITTSSWSGTRCMSRIT